VTEINGVDGGGLEHEGGENGCPLTLPGLFGCLSQLVVSMIEHHCPCVPVINGS
jgi:hypothetical protein